MTQAALVLLHAVHGMPGATNQKSSVFGFPNEMSISDSFQAGSPALAAFLEKARHELSPFLLAKGHLEKIELETHEILGALREAFVRERLETIDIAQIKAVTGGRLRIEPLREAGLESVAAVLDASVAKLEKLDGISLAAAKKLKAAAAQLAKAAGEKPEIQLDPSGRPPAHERLLELVRLRRHAESCLKGQPVPDLGQIHELLEKTELASATGFLAKLKRLIPGYGMRLQESLAACEQLRERLADKQFEAQKKSCLQILETDFETPIWQDFLSDPSGYYAELRRLGVGEAGAGAIAGQLPEHIVEAVHAHPLDESLLNVSLRGYQSFGTRYALNQGRVLLGDEMGLGKTVQALSAMAHLAAAGHTGFMVVCPAAVVGNWALEIKNKSKLRPLIIGSRAAHSQLRHLSVAKAVAVVSYETLRSLHGGGHLEDLSLQMLVADEAHYVKNPGTGRSQALGCVAEKSVRVIFLSGTPLENRLTEFYNLIGYLQPVLANANQESVTAAVISPAHFRQQVAPVYLRRNQTDVLTELPGKIESDEWLTLGKAERALYEKQVMAANFMGMRQAVVAGTPKPGVKLQRLLEIVEEALEDGQKVLVFSYFLKVIEAVMKLLPKAYGPITGSESSAQRLRSIQAFTEDPKPAVLVAQILAGGTGLNIQAASVVVLMEPQIKPSLESQAVARAHRMGQVRPVQVFRLLAADTVDQRMVEILKTKTEVFEQYAKESAVKESSEQAIDVSDTSMARQIIEMEQQRIRGRASVVAPRKVARR